MKVFILDVQCCDQRRRDKKILNEYFLLNGLDVTNDIRDADYIMLISCAVNKSTQEESKKIIYEAKKFVTDDKIIDVGCFIHELSANKEFDNIKSIPPSIHARLDAAMIEAGWVGNVMHPFIDMKFKGIINPDEESTWFLSLGEGCSLQNCAYCVKSKATGKLTHTSRDQILKSYKTGLECGYKRFRFIGEDVASYGVGTNDTFPGLVEFLLKNTPDKFKPIHFNTFMNGINPYRLEQYEEKFYEILEYKDCIFDGLQISVQSFNNRILDLCKRNGDPDKWVKIIRNIKRISSGTELWIQGIIGLPTQTKEEAEYELEVFDSIPAEVFHVYGYSHNKGSYFYNNFDFSQKLSDEMFKYLLQIIPKHKGRLSNQAVRSVLITRFHELGKNCENEYYHKYRGLELSNI